jgi:hypothetical protein
LKIAYQIFLKMKRKVKVIRLKRQGRILHAGILLLLLLTTGTLVAQYDDQEEYEIRVTDVVFTPDSNDLAKVIDTITVRFNLFPKGTIETGDRYLGLSESDLAQIIVKEFDGRKEGRVQPEYIQGSLQKMRQGVEYKTEIPEDLYISMLIDRSGSIPQDALHNLKAAVEKTTREKKLNLYYSLFDEDITRTKRAETSIPGSGFEVTGKKTLLYNAIYSKLMEFDSGKVIPNGLSRNNELKYAREGKKAIIVVSNGKNQVENIDKLYITSFTTIWEPDLIEAVESYRGDAFIYAMSIGREADDPEIFRILCTASGNPNGYFERVAPDQESIENTFKKLGRKIYTQDMLHDYEIKLKYKSYTTFAGEARGLSIKIESGGKIYKTPENQFFSYGTKISPKSTGEKQIVKVLLLGLLTGVIVFLLVMIIIQMLVPLIRNRIFTMKYVKKYKPSENLRYKECPYCGDPLNAGEKVVVKCQHIVHHLCWKEFDHMCPEYGQNCNEGKEEFYDISDPFSKKNKIYYLSWVLYGMIGGFITWILYVLLTRKPGMLHDLSAWLTTLLRPGISVDNLGKFTDKIALFLIIGMFMGFFLTAFFSYIEEYRHKNLRIYARIFLRGLFGIASGFLAFFIGSIFLIIINKPSIWILDMIPWIFFGTSIGFIMSVKTTITWKHGVIGGLVSSIFFLVIYALIKDLAENAFLIGFMLYGAGLGTSIATVKSRSEHFFLKIIAGKKNQDIIPVHKWMSSSGGHNEVYIGRAFACEIQMNWEKNNEDIASKHAKLYINSRGLPVIISLLKDKLINFNDRFDLDVGKEYQLYNGVTFKIGQTVFQYVESE